jgi:hypothetical protein
MSNWTDAIVGERMALDREFSDRVRESDFSNQEWGLVMTATDFEIEDANDPDRARIVADTTNLPQMMPELENVRSQMGGMSGGESKSSGGVFDSIKGALGLGDDGGDDERLETAERLVQEYADELQEKLEEKGRWDEVRQSYDG